jgi:hypothetical protein
LNKMKKIRRTRMRAFIQVCPCFCRLALRPPLTQPQKAESILPGTPSSKQFRTGVLSTLRS